MKMLFCAWFNKGCSTTTTISNSTTTTNNDNNYITVVLLRSFCLIKLRGRRSSWLVHSVWILRWPNRADLMWRTPLCLRGDVHLPSPPPTHPPTPLSVVQRQYLLHQWKRQQGEEEGEKNAESRSYIIAVCVISVAAAAEVPFHVLILHLCCTNTACNCTLVCSCTLLQFKIGQYKITLVSK